jgi:anti-sigma B factor antagonist
MNYSIEHRDKILIMKVKDETVESQVSADLKAKVLIIAQPDIDALIFDLTDVKAMDSSGLGALLLANRQLNEHSIPVIIVGVQPFVKSLMSMTRIDELFDHFDSVDEAEKAIREIL